MKLLSFLNISNIDDINSDSGFIFNRIILDEFTKHGHVVAAVLPVQLNTKKLDLNYKIYYANLGSSKYEVRFNFNWNQMLSIIADFSPDYILVNQAELTAAFRALLISNRVTNIQIITYCHYPALYAAEPEIRLDDSLNDNNLCCSIVTDILQAVNIADYFFIQSAFAKELLVNAAQKFHITLNKEIYLLPPPYDPFLYTNTQSLGNFIIYNHRLYENYGTAQILELAKQNVDKQFLISNPMAHRSAERSSADPKPEQYASQLAACSNVVVVDGGSNRVAYKNYLMHGKVGIAAFRPSCVWSMSAIDCIGMNIPVISPDFAAYREFIPAILRFNSIQDEVVLLEKLLSDNSFFDYCLLESRKILFKLSPSKAYNTICKTITT